MSEITNMDLKEMQLEDEALEAVSGGTVGKDKGIFKCAYCHQKHEMTRYSPWTIVYEGVKYRNAEKYVCKMQGDFYIMVDNYGNELYFNKEVKPIPQP